MMAPLRHDWFGLARFQPGEGRAHPGAVCMLLESVGSTNDFLLGRGDGAVGRVCRWDGWGWDAQPQQRLAPPAPPPPACVVVARRQTRGRGRRGSPWIDTGGLMLSWLVPPVPARGLTGLAVWSGLQAALALRDAFAVAVELKWPNDLLVGGRKLGGVLVEAARTPWGPRLVAGLGLNLGMRAGELPAALRGRATSLRMETGHAPLPAVAAAALLARFDAELPRFRDEGWAPYLEAYADCDHLRGLKVELETGQGVVTGRALGIDQTGALALRREDGREMRLLAGDVRVRGVSAHASPSPRGSLARPGD